MKNEEQWRPTKFRIHNGQAFPSHDTRELALSSRISAGNVAKCMNRHLAAHSRGRFLDLGCGKAPYYGIYRPLVDEVICVDWESSLHGDSHLDMHADLSQPLPLESESFDTILLSSVLEHIPTPWGLVNEIARVLRPGGKIILNVPFLYVLHEVPHDYYRYTKFALERFLTDAGLKICLLEPTGGAVVVIGDLSSKALARVPLISKPIVHIVNTIASLGLKLGPIAKFDRRTAEVIPNGYFLVAEKPMEESVANGKPSTAIHE